MRDADSRMAETFARTGGAARGLRRRPAEPAVDPWSLGVALAAVASILVPSLLLKRVAGVECVDTVFLIAVVAVAIRYGLWPSLASAVTSALAYDFFFVPPVHELTITHPDNAVTLPVFMLAAVVTSHLTARFRTEALAARRCAATAEALYAFSRRVAGIIELDELLRATVQQIATMLDLEAVLLLPDGTGQPAVRASTPSWREIEASGDGDPGARRADVRFLDLRTNDAVVGQVGIARHGTRTARKEDLLTDDEQKTLDALLSQAAVAIERIRFGRERDEARLAAETERLRAALLTSLSHDLKTPLSSILGAITALRSDRNLYGETARDELESMIQDEAERLDRFVANLLHMTRLEAGAIVPDRQPVDVGEVIGSAVRQAAPMLGRHAVKVDVAPDLPLLDLDPGLLEHVLVNLLDNAAKYAPDGTRVTVRAHRQAGSVAVEVADEGRGLPPGGFEWVFERFRRACPDGEPRSGTGLGLAICRGFVEALGGRIRAANREDAPGAVFTITFPGALFSVAKADGS
jgi:two-component system sensor histidine kinase KdpD